MNCPDCARAVAENEEYCPHCGSVFRVPATVGSGILRPLAVPSSGDARAYRESALIDHQYTMRRLRTAWRASRQGRGQLVSLVGENGSGRSRLIRELGLTIDEEAPAARWLVGRAHSHATYSPLHLLVDLLAPWVGDVGEADVATRLAIALVALAKEAPPEEGRALRDLAHEAGEATERATLATFPLADLLSLALRRVARDETLVIILEDLEWGDAASLGVLDVLLPRLLDGTTLVISTHHADWSHEWPDIARHALLSLGTLSWTESARLITDVTAGREMALALTEALAVAGHGNPLLLEQATLAVLESGLTDPALVPTTIQAAIQARNAALPDEARDVLLASALLGPRFTYRAIATVLANATMSRETLDAALHELGRRRLIVRWHEGPDVTYRFTHALIQEVAYGTLPRTTRQRLEARVADWLQTEGAVRRPDVTTVSADLDVPLAEDAAVDEVEAYDVVAGIAATPALPFRAIVEALPRGGKRRAEALARIVLADLPADHRASLALCLEHGYSYAQAGATLGLPREAVQAHLLEARLMFKRLQDAGEATAKAAVVEVPQ